MKTSTCTKCGKVFFTDYYDDGYNDHVVNFSEKERFILSIGEEEASREIAIHGNDIRRLAVIKSRLDCFSKWNIDDVFKRNVIQRVNAIVVNLENLRKSVYEILNKMTDDQKSYLYHVVTSEAELSGYSYGYSESVLHSDKDSEEST